MHSFVFMSFSCYRDIIQEHKIYMSLHKIKYRKFNSDFRISRGEIITDEQTFTH